MNNTKDCFIQDDILLKREKYRQSYGQSNQQQNSYKSIHDFFLLCFWVILAALGLMLLFSTGKACALSPNDLAIQW